MARAGAKTVVKLTYCICRKPGLSQEEFSRYWANVHGPIGARDA